MAELRRIRPRESSQSGVALLIALFVLLLLSAIGLGMMYATNTETSINANFKDKQAAVYGSLSGIQEARERITPALCPPPNYTATVNYAICAPSVAPSSGAPSSSGSATVYYIINPKNGETIDPTDATAGNNYFDTELCHENILGLTSSGSGSPCDPTASGAMPSTTAWRTFYDDSSSSTAGPFKLTLPLTTKWTRILRKSNNTGLVAANGNGSDSSVLCWDGKQQVPLPAGYDPTTCGPTHAVMAIKFNPSSVTQSTGWNPAPNVVIAASPTGDNATAHVVTSGTPSGGVGSVTVSNNGSGYTGTPDVVFTGGGGSGATAHANMNFGAPIVGLTSKNLGSQCFTAGSTPAITWTGGGGGTGASGHGVVGSTYNCIYSLTVGANCAKNETVKFLVSGTGSGFSSDTVITTGSGSGNFTGQALNIVNPGTGFNGGALTVTVQDTTNASKQCTNVTYTAVFGYSLTDMVLNTNPTGNGYTSAPTAAVSGGIGAASLAASATGTLGTATSGVITVTVDTPGTGYTTAPTVAFQCPNSAGVNCTPTTGAVATASVANTYIVTGFVVDHAGSGYGSIPTVSLQCPGGSPCGGDGALVRAILNGTSSLTYGLIYQLTSLGYTSTGARAMTQAEVATNVRGLAVSGALTLDGPAPVVTNIPNSSQFYVSGVTPASCPGTYSPVPAIGAFDDPNAPTSPTAVDTIISDIPSGRTNNYYGSGPSPDVENVYGSLGDTLGTTTGLQGLAQDVYAQASINGTAYSSNPGSIAMGSPSNYVVDYVNGDVTISGSSDGYGTLLVSGTLTFNGNMTWHGVVFVIGTGNIQFKGGGNGNIDGSVIVANICSGASPCNMPNGAVASPNSLRPTQGTPTYGWNGGGGNQIQYNPCSINSALAGFYTTVRPQTSPLKVISSRTVTY